jgi:hypothetical protein
MYELQYYDGTNWQYHSIHKTEGHAEFVKESMELETENYRNSWRIVELVVDHE